MGWLKDIFALLTGSTANKALDIALEKIEDVDKRNALVLEWFRVQADLDKAKIARVTVPWVDALHKIGRQLYIFALTAFVCYCIIAGVNLNAHLESLGIAGGLGGLYVLMKGRGQ